MTIPRAYYQNTSYGMLCVLIVYMAGWLFNKWPIDPELVLLIAVSFTGVYWVMNQRVWSKEKVPGEHEAPWIANTAGSFLLLFAIFMFRSFCWEPFIIPSGSMLPTLLIGDVIAVDKHRYGFQMPYFHTQLYKGRDVERGDPIVFRYPEDPSIYFIKRAIAVEGDTIEYTDKIVSINGVPLEKLMAQPSEALRMHGAEHHQMYLETNTGRTYYTQNDILKNSDIQITDRANSLWADHCTWKGPDVKCTVPAGHVFAMGDNRDNSMDSRYWGFVPVASITGRASQYRINKTKLSDNKPLAGIP